MVSRICSCLPCCSLPEEETEEALIDEKTFNELGDDPASPFYSPRHQENESSLPPPETSHKKTRSSLPKEWTTEEKKS